MTALVRSAAKLFLVLQIPFVFACAGSGPGGPGEPDAGARFSGLLTVSEEGSAGADEAFRGATALVGARVGLASAQSGGVTTVTTSGAGFFSSELPAGAYTVSIAMSEGPPVEFSLVLPPGGALFAQGRVDQTPAGDFTLNVQVFRDEDADAQPDDEFRVQILDRVQGDEESGFEEVVSEEEAEASVMVCHAPPGNPDAAHTVSVGAPSVPAHLAHGDTEGACVDDTEGEDPEDEGEDGQAKVLVCHVPPGNPDHPFTIEVGESAVPAHLAHGDTEGACEGDDVDDEEGGDDEGEAKVLVCHVPPGNPEHPFTIEIGESAVPAHLAHGDTEGACADGTPPVEEGEGDEGEGGEGEG